MTLSCALMVCIGWLKLGFDDGLLFACSSIVEGWEIRAWTGGEDRRCVDWDWHRVHLPAPPQNSSVGRAVDCRVQ
jgi:hypothetical protein